LLTFLLTWTQAVDKVANVTGRLFLIFFLCFFAGQSWSLRSTEFEAYTDPDYEGYQFKKVMLVVESGFEATKIITKRLTKEFNKRGITLVEHKRMFPPTRDWTSEARNKILKQKEIDAVLVITPGASAASIMPAITQTYGSVSGNYNESTGSFSGSGSASSYQIYSAKSKAEFSAVLFDIPSSRTAWYVDILTKAGGTFFVGDKGDAKAAAKGVVKGLIENGHIRKK
jgi:hypothetical protein